MTQRRITLLSLLIATSACGGANTDALPVPDAGEAAVDGAIENDAGVIEVLPDAGPVSTPYTWWQDVEPIVRARCQLCHLNPPLYGAPRPYVEYADTQVDVQPGVQVHQLMAYRVVANQNRMPPSSQPQLTPEQRMIITNWSQGGAPEGVRPTIDPDAGVVDTDAGAPPADGGTPPDPDGGVSTNDAGTPGRVVSGSFEVHATEPNSNDPYVMPVGATNYVCWSYTIPQGAPQAQHAFRFEPLIDDTVHTHHTLLFVNSNQDQTDGVPFSCDGFPLAWNMIAGWAPGRMADEIPAPAGVPLPPGTQVILQVHYDRVMTGGATDNSGMRVVLTDDANLQEAGMVWSGVIWSSNINGSNVSRTHTCTLNSNITAFSIFPHMHKTGTRITLELQRSGTSAWIPIVDISGWSFEDQPNVPVDPSNQMLRSGDKLRTKCWWDTMGQSMSFGEASDDEMCFNFVYHYPKIGFQYACVGYQP